MSFVDQIRAVAEGMLGFGARPIRTDWGRDRQKRYDSVLALLYAETVEGLMSGLTAHLYYASPQSDLPASMFIGLPVGLELTVSDAGPPRRIHGVVSEVRIGASDGELTCYRLTLIDAVQLLRGKFNSRIFKRQRLPDILHTLFAGYRRTAAFASAVDLDVSQLQLDRYPERMFVRQANEPDGKFIERLARRDGITYYARPGDQHGKIGDIPAHSIVMMDRPDTVPQARTSPLRYGGPTGTHTTDTITSIAWAHALTPRRASVQSPDFKTARVDSSTAASSLDRGDAGNSLASLIEDYRIYGPHAADTAADLSRLTRLRVLSHDLRAERVDCVGTIRDIGLLEWFELAGHPDLDFGPQAQRELVAIEIHRRMWNNLPKGLDERAQALLATSRDRLRDDALTHPALRDEPPETGDRYQVAFSCVRRGVPLTPAYDPVLDFPPTPPIYGRVVAPQAITVHTDEYGRAWIQILGLSKADHPDGGTSGTPADSAPLLVMNPWAGDRYGFSFPLREGMYVILTSIEGDPDKLVISGTRWGFIKGVNWYTILGELFVERLGGDAALRRKLARDDIETEWVNHCLLVRAGPFPRLGAPEEGLPEPYVFVNKVLRVLRNPKPDGLHLYDPALENGDSSNARTWAARFDLPDAPPIPEPPAIVPESRGKRRQSIRGGSPCPEAGWWHTPAKPGSERYFEVGEAMPVVEGSQWGTTHWVWVRGADENQ